MKPRLRPNSAAEAVTMAFGAARGHLAGSASRSSARSRSGDWAFLRGRALAHRLAIEVGPLAAFFVSFYLYGIFVATGVFMATTTIAGIASMRAEKRLPVLPLLSMALIFLFGGLTLYWEDERFIMMRPTAVNLFFGLALAASWWMHVPLLKRILAPGLLLTDAGWQKLTVRLALFLFALAGLNELVWRSFDTEVWVAFKTFATVPLNVVFFAFQMRLLRSHTLGDARRA